MRNQYLRVGGIQGELLRIEWSNGKEELGL